MEGGPCGDGSGGGIGGKDGSSIKGGGVRGVFTRWWIEVRIMGGLELGMVVSALVGGGGQQMLERRGTVQTETHTGLESVSRKMAIGKCGVLRGGRCDSRQWRQGC